MNAQIDWGALFLQPEWMSRVEKLAERRFGAGGLAEEAAGYVLQVLSEDQWKRCKKFKGNSRPETYLYTLINNALEEFSRARFGRARPPEWLKTEGPAWVEVWKRLCMERQPEQTILEGFGRADRDVQAIGRMVRTIKARMPWCGSSSQEIPLTYYADEKDEEHSAADNLSAEHGSLEQARQSSYEVLVLALSYLISVPEDSDAREAQERGATAQVADLVPVFESLRNTVALTDEERLIIGMAYRDGIKKNAIAQSLGIKAHQPGRIIKGALQRIARALHESGLNLDVLEP